MNSKKTKKACVPLNRWSLVVSAGVIFSSVGFSRRAARGHARKIFLALSKVSAMPVGEKRTTLI